MKIAKFLVPLGLNKTLLIPIIWAAAIFCEETLNKFGSEKVDTENVRHSMEGGKEI